MADILRFDYEGQKISFEFADGNKMINATEMAKPFGKPVANFLRLDETKQYLQLLEERYSDLNIAPPVVEGIALSHRDEESWQLACRKALPFR